MTGKAYLVGAGPGRPDLITVRGLVLLRLADTVLYDHLVDQALLREAPPSAQVIYVGKQPGRHEMPQDRINELLVDHVRAGRQVVRLKGGDPFVFGRGGEEALALARAGLPFEVVPGVSSAIAAPAYAGVPVTHRHMATAFAVVTGHEDPTRQPGDPACCATDWAALARIPTLVVLMGVGRLATICATLIAAGRRADTPAAAISWGATIHQQVVRATLATLPGEVEVQGLVPPAVVVIGEVAALADELSWFVPSDGPDCALLPALNDMGTLA
ncbi:MAG: uroporphyrinogen-III C-methyltransferase [Chloroflexi bacterium]|nr:uroporphyrinogen-III C-methyltransferase [Chloroflexota bacterium]MCL5274565.1 uroporphyrinogen-III C-methyltransferase [Chloroflexota bacterium]